MLCSILMLTCRICGLDRISVAVGNKMQSAASRKWIVKELSNDTDEM